MSNLNLTKPGIHEWPTISAIEMMKEEISAMGPWTDKGQACRNVEMVLARSALEYAIAFLERKLREIDARDAENITFTPQ